MSFGSVMPGVLAEGSQQEQGENARMASFMGAYAICDLVKTTLGPKGMDKILQSMSGGEVKITNDGATILSSIMIDNPAAKVLVEISKVQDDEVGDGTTSVCVLAGELLKQAEGLIDQKIHPQTIVSGYRMATDCAREALTSKGTVDNSGDPEKLRKDLMNIARTTLSSKVVHQDKDHFATLCVNAVMRLKGSTNLDMIQIIKRQGGTMVDSYLEEGFILNKTIGIGQPKRMENAKVRSTRSRASTRLLGHKAAPAPACWDTKPRQHPLAGTQSRASTHCWDPKPRQHPLFPGRLCKSLL
jgi:T-complex protein 1 subunit beta